MDADTTEYEIAESALQLAITVAGGPTELARQLDISHASVCGWAVCPSSRAITIESITGVRREHLRPDLYPLGELLG